MKKINLTNVNEAKDGGRLPAGGYVCKITKVDDISDKEYLSIEYDIARGEYAGYYAANSEKYGYWGGHYNRSYKEKALPFFKRMCSAINRSNNGFKFDAETNADEQTLVGKIVGLVLCEEEYIGNDGNTKTRLYVERELPVDEIINGKFKVKPLKKIKEDSSSSDASFVNVPEGAPDELPFGMK